MQKKFIPNNAKIIDLCILNIGCRSSPTPNQSVVGYFWHCLREALPFVIYMGLFISFIFFKPPCLTLSFPVLSLNLSI